MPNEQDLDLDVLNNLEKLAKQYDREFELLGDPDFTEYVKALSPNVVLSLVRMAKQLKRVKKVIEESPTCGEDGCATIGTCELRMALCTPITERLDVW